MLMPDTGDVVYRINERGEICFVNAAYDAFARANGGERLLGAAVLRRPLWDFVCDPPTRQLYREIIARVRAGTLTRFRLRCDAPDRRRLLEMFVARAADGTVEFRVRTLAEEARPAQALLDPAAPRGDLLRACGWCKKVRVGSVWVEVEDAVARLRLFEEPAVPALTHGICDECYFTISATIATP
jgi:hypothetical protein